MSRHVTYIWGEGGGACHAPQSNTGRRGTVAINPLRSIFTHRLHPHFRVPRPGDMSFLVYLSASPLPPSALTERSLHGRACCPQASEEQAARRERATAGYAMGPPVRRTIFAYCHLITPLPPLFCVRHKRNHRRRSAEPQGRGGDIDDGCLAGVDESGICALCGGRHGDG